MLKAEYNALCDEDCNDPDFLTIETDVADELAEYFDQIKIIGRLREVQVLKGFERISHNDSFVAPLSRKPMNWLPGNEMFGEGIFIRFNENKVKEWENRNFNRYRALIRRSKEKMC